MRRISPIIIGIFFAVFLVSAAQADYNVGIYISDGAQLKDPMDLTFYSIDGFDPTVPPAMPHGPSHSYTSTITWVGRIRAVTR